MRVEQESQLAFALLGVQLALAVGASAAVPSDASRSPGAATLVSEGVGDHLAYETSPSEVFAAANATIAQFELPLLGIAIRRSTLIAVLSNSIHSINVDGHLDSKSRAHYILPLSEPLENPLVELKLFNESSVFVCDIHFCRLCSLVTSKCIEYFRQEESEEEAAGELQWVGATVTADERLVVRVAVRYTEDNSGADISKYATISEQFHEAVPPTPQQSAVDVHIMKDNRVSTAFNRNGYTYFVGSARRPYEPIINAMIQTGVEVTSTRITRICDRDETSDLESRIDLALLCGDFQSNEDFQSEAAEYDEERDELNVILSSTKNATLTMLCSFKMDQVEKAIDRVWTDCQNSTFGDPSLQECRLADVNKLPYHCFIFTRLADGNAMTLCEPFLRSRTPISNCKLHEYNGTSYRYGWLEQFNAFYGTLTANVPDLTKEIVAIGHVADDEAFFALTADFALHRVNRDSFSKNRALLWSRQLNTQTKFSFATDSNHRRIYFITDSKIDFIDVSCPGLYKDCDALEKAQWMDPLQCQWCSHPNRPGYAVAQFEKCSFAKVFQVCSPFIEHVKPSPISASKTLFEAYGDRFNKLDKIGIDVCNEKCVTRSVDPKKLSCVAPFAYDIHQACIMNVAGDLPNYGAYNISQPIDATRTNQSSARSGSTKKVKAVASAIAVVILVVLIILIICLVRRYQARQRLKRKQADGTSSQITFGSTNPLPFDRAAFENGRYDGGPHPNECVLHTLRPPIYERLFREIDPKLKIPLEDLHIGEEIGKGNFGVVYKGIYLDGSGLPKEVACKTIESQSDGVISGVSEFLREGLIMANFDHPNVARLIGISLTRFNSPVIVTDYLANGDLRHYIVNPENRLTFGNLLEFGIQIAEGMSYLHEKKFIHRDLAARNCMLDGKLRVKISDFGLSRDVSLCGMYEAVNKDRGIPIRWMPIESLEDQQYTFKADVWAYGVVLWELATRGLVPYADLDMVKILRLLKSGHRLSKPKGCPDILYQQVMLVCWMEDPQRRPTFNELAEMMQDVVLQLRKGVSSSGLLDSHYERVSPRSVSTTPVAYPKPSAGPIITDL